MTGPLRIGVVPGVVPDRWVRTWRERRPDVPLAVVPLTDAVAGAALGTSSDLALARLPVAGVEPEAVHAIPLWEETPLAVAARDHPLRAFDSVTLADLAGEERYEGWDEGVLDLVAAGHGIVVMPQAVLRGTGRRDLVGRPVSDAPTTRVGLVWLRSGGGPLVDEFVGVVRGRTSNSSRGAPPAPAPAPRARERAPRARAPRRRR